MKIVKCVFQDFASDFPSQRQRLERVESGGNCWQGNDVSAKAVI